MLDTSLPGVFAVGDARSGNVKRVASAVGEGAIAVHLVHGALAGTLGGKRMSECTHMGQIKDVKPHARVCGECLKMGDTWVHLRLCMTCGHVGCCDSSKNKHATKHFHAVKHPIMKSIEAGENWGWCYVDEVELDFG